MKKEKEKLNKLSGDIPVLSPEENSKQKKKWVKRKIIIGAVVLALLGGISWYVLYVMPQNKTIAGDDSLGMYGSKKSYIYYDPDYNLDVTGVPEYMELDRDIYYKKGGERIVLTANERNTNDQNFFIKYFDIVINGRYEEYNALFTEDYYKSNEPYDRFAPQMIYNIEIEKLSENYENGTTVYGYNVSYKIYNNNGTFRNDIGSDGSKTLYFGLAEENGKVLIDRISYYAS